MGSSMNPPTKSSIRNPQSRFSTRSLRKSSRKSVLLNRKSSLSVSKLQEISRNDHNYGNQTIQNTQIRNGELFIMSRYEEPQINIKETNQINAQKLNLGDEGDLKSPNFRSDAQCGVEYGLSQWVPNTNSKDINANETRNQDITISFSKAKNHPNNLFHEEVEAGKSSLKQILEYGDEDVYAQNPKKEYLDQQMDIILTLKSVYSENYKTPGQSIENTPKKNNNQSENAQELMIQSKTNSEKKGEMSTNSKHKEKKELVKRGSDLSENKDSNYIEEKLTPCFNDYDTDFPKAPKETENSASKNTIKLSKKMQQLKQKIASRATLLKGAGDLSQYSLQNTSIRKFRNSCSLDKSADSRNSSKLNRIREKICRTMLAKEQSREQLGSPPKEEQKFKKKASNDEDKIMSKPQKIKSPKHKNEIKLIKVKSQEDIKLPKLSNNLENAINKIDSPKKSIKKQSKIDLNNTFSKDIENDVKQKQKKPQTSTQKPQKSKDKKLTFTDMVKKEHHGNKSKKGQSEHNGQDYIKFSQVIQSSMNILVDENLFSSTHESNRVKVSQDYEFFDMREGTKYRNIENRKEKDKKERLSQIAKLKKVSQELNKKEPKLKSSVNSLGFQQSQNNSTQEQSVKNKTYCDKSYEHDRHPGNMTTINYQEMLASFQEYMIKEEEVQKPQERLTHSKSSKKKTRSLEHSNSFGTKNRLIIF